ncbi:YceI family protein [Flavobacterium sp.]|jgi:polyisoprenoid-binding protein YceI|uniref:YceI family protein n=1 Tax=Flavobacterium sp. TaxID=239 RepID=UPI0033409680
MKKLRTIAVALFVATATIASAQNKKIDVAKSKIEWVGKKVTGQHNGVVDFKGGTLIFKGKKLTGGSFLVDMTSINATDLQGENQDDLNSHLKDDDFFGTEKYPTSKLVFKKLVDKGNGTYVVTADLTIKDVTAPVTFELKVNGSTATTSFKIDRTKYGIKYGSGSFFDNLGNKTINDEFDLTVTIRF